MTNTNTALTITRTSQDFYKVTTDRMLADGSYYGDGCVRLDGNVLRSVEKRGHIRIGGLMRVQLGAKSLARVQSLAIGESATF